MRVERLRTTAKPLNTLNTRNWMAESEPPDSGCYKWLVIAEGGADLVRTQIRSGTSSTAGMIVHLRQATGVVKGNAKLSRTRMNWPPRRTIALQVGNNCRDGEHADKEKDSGWHKSCPFIGLLGLTHKAEQPAIRSMRGAQIFGDGDCWF